MKNIRNITRRSFMKALTGIASLSFVSIPSSGGDKEFSLRQEISELMTTTQTNVGYFTGHGRLCVKQSLNPQNIIDGYKDISRQNLYRIRERLNQNISEGYPEISMHE